MTNDYPQFSLDKKVRNKSIKTPSPSALMFIKQFARVYMCDGPAGLTAMIAN